MGNGRQLPITLMGFVVISIDMGNAKLSNVLVAPDIQKNLLSVYHFYNDNEMNFEFDNLGFSIKDCATQHPIFQGWASNSLYKLMTPWP
jgi:hypothetical protein